MGGMAGKKYPRCDCQKIPAESKSDADSESKNYHIDQFGAEESSFVLKTISPLVRPVMTEEQIQIVMDTWQEIKKDIDRIGVIVFARLFEVSPGIQATFTPFRGLSIEEVKNKIQPHSLRVMATVEKAINRLHRTEKFDSFMKEFSARHVTHLDRPEYLDLFPPQFLGTVQPIMDERWTREVETAWVNFLQLILYYMKEAILGVK